MSDSKPQRKTLFLIDGMSQIFRAFFALPPLRTSKGIPTNAVRGFTTMLRKLIQAHQPDYVGVAFDMAGPTFRHDSFADYKKDRPDMPEDLAAQLPYIRRACAALRIPILQSEKFEADDILGTLAKKAEDAGLDVVIVTQDKDMFQLVNDHVRTLRANKDGTETFYDAAGVEQFMGLKPDKIVDYLGLCGDKVDNIPGAPGIGEKGALKLLQDFGTIESLVENWKQVANKRYSESLRDHRELILKSKELAAIRMDAPVELKLEDLKLEPPDPQAVVELFRELEFNTLLKEFEKNIGGSEGTPVGESDITKSQPAYQRLSSLEEIQRYSARLKAVPVVALAIGPSQEKLDSELIGDIGVATAEGEVTAIQVGQDDFWRKSGLAEILEGRKPGKIIHDSKSAHVRLERSTGISLNGIADDTLLMSYLLDATQENHSLDREVRARLNSEVPTGAAATADFTMRLAPLVKREIEDLGLKEVYETVELPVAAVLARMELWGVKIDLDILGGLSVEFETRLGALTKDIYKLAGQEFNINSPKQLGEILFEKMNLPGGKKSRKSGQYSTAVEVLEELAANFELPRLILDFRQIAKLKSTYVDALPKLVHPQTGRLHTSFNQAVAATGRLSSAEPNLQNIPIRSDLGKKIRSAFVPEKGFVFLSGDYSQIELRLLAHFSEDPVLMAAFQRGEDIHARTAEEIFGVPRLMQTADHRRQAKAINFGIVYGLSPFGLAQQLGIPQSEAKKYIEAYFERYRGVRKFLDRTIAETRQSGETRTLLGRLRRIPDILSKNPALRNFAERTAVNTPLQGTASDLIKLAMIRIDEQLSAKKSRAKMILQVHDELVFEVPEEEAVDLRKLVKQEMEHVYKLRVPLIVDISMGKNWMEAK
ncbi:MAG: DNA polymerase I [Acidobacteriia bacterium]|nr:DNA polymerase I [Terriglobia bacterium]